MKTSVVAVGKKLQEGTAIQNSHKTAIKETVLISWKCVKCIKDL